MTGRGGDERGAVERVEQRVGQRPRRRGARHVPDECDLAEVLARTLLAHRHAVDLDPDLPLGDEVEAVAAVALPEDLLAGVLLFGRKTVRERVDRGRRERTADRIAA